MIRDMRHNCPAMLAVAAIGVFVSGCGGASSSTVTTSTTATATAADAHAFAYARAVNLRASDVPGMVSRVRERRAGAPPLGAAVARCDGGVIRADEVVGIRSPRFRNRLPGRGSVQGAASTRLSSEAVTSEVYVMRSEALAHKDVAATASPRARACLKKVRARAEAEGFERHVAVSLLPVTLPGASAYGLRVSGVEVGEPHSSSAIHVYADTFGFAVGPAEVVLKATGVGHPVNSSTERRLLAVLYSRATAHQL